MKIPEEQPVLMEPMEYQICEHEASQTCLNKASSISLSTYVADTHHYISSFGLPSNPNPEDLS